MRRRTWIRRAAFLATAAGLTVGMMLAARMTTPVKAQAMRGETRVGWQTKGVQPTARESVEAPPPPAAEPTNAAPAGQPSDPVPGEIAFMEDPEAAAESYRDKTRKDADAVLAKLTGEAETLRARLQKVEAGLAHWQAIRAAIDRSQPADPAPAQPAPGEIAPAVPTDPVPATRITEPIQEIPPLPPALPASPNT